MRNRRKFSIIIPTYNRAWCIERAIGSVLSQKYQNWELIIIDDGSTDSTKIVVEKYLVDSRIKYSYKKNGGVNCARNRGIHQSNGEFILFLDSDDELTINALNEISDVARQYVDRSVFVFQTVGEKGQVTSYINKVAESLDFIDFVSGKFCGGELFYCIKKESLDIELFDEGICGGESVLLWRLIRSYGIVLSEKVVRIYHVDSVDSMISSELSSEKVENIVKIQKTLLRFFLHDLQKGRQYKKLGEIYFVLARALALLGHKKDSAEYFLKGIRNNPFDAKREILFLLSLFDQKLIINNLIIRSLRKFAK